MKTLTNKTMVSLQSKNTNHQKLDLINEKGCLKIKKNKIDFVTLMISKKYSVKCHCNWS